MNYFHNLEESKQNALVNVLANYMCLSLNADGSVKDSFDDTVTKFWNEQGKGIDVPDSFLSYDIYDNCWRGNGTVDIYKLKAMLIDESEQFEDDYEPETRSDREEANHDPYLNRY